MKVFMVDVKNLRKEVEPMNGYYSGFGVLAVAIFLTYFIFMSYGVN